MRKAPKIGQRVVYRETIGKGEPWEEVRTCTGTVTKIYQKHDDVFDDDGDFVRAGQVLPSAQWKAAVRVDRPLPKWWAYGEMDQFAPGVAELQPINDQG
jgi:hypothetical protein